MSLTAVDLSPGRQSPERSHFKQLQHRCAELCYSAVRTLSALPDRESRYLTRIDELDGREVAAMRSGGQPHPTLTIEDVWNDPDWGYESAMALRAFLKEEQERRAQFYYRPTPEEVSRCIKVCGWLSWLGRERRMKAERRIICSRAFEIPVRLLAKRFGRSDDTIRRWEAAGLSAIGGEYHREIEAMR